MCTCGQLFLSIGVVFWRGDWGHAMAHTAAVVDPFGFDELQFDFDLEPASFEGSLKHIRAIILSLTES